MAKHVLAVTGGDLTKVLRLHTDGVYVEGTLESIPEAERKKFNGGLGTLKMEGDDIFEFNGIYRPKQI